MSFRLFSLTLSWPCRCRSPIAILGEAYVGTTSFVFLELLWLILLCRLNVVFKFIHALILYFTFKLRNTGHVDVFC